MDDHASSMNGPMSRRERRELRRAERTDARKSAGRRRFLRRLALWGASIILLGGIGWGMVKLASDARLPSEGGILAVPVSATDQVRGPSDAPVTLVEYSDFQCPACAAFQPVIEQALQDPALAGKVRFVYRHFPLSNIHANARLAGQAAEAAALQGKFWEMHDALFAGQQAWAKLSGAAARETFAGYARTIGVDVERWRQDVDSAPVRTAVSDDYDGGLRSGVNATPTFFVNGNRMPSPNGIEQFKAFIIDALPRAHP